MSVKIEHYYIFFFVCGSTEKGFALKSIPRIRNVHTKKTNTFGRVYIGSVHRKNAQAAQESTHSHRQLFKKKKMQSKVILRLYYTWVTCRTEHFTSAMIYKMIFIDKFVYLAFNAKFIMYSTYYSGYINVPATYYYWMRFKILAKFLESLNSFTSHASRNELSLDLYSVNWIAISKLNICLVVWLVCTKRKTTKIEW